MRIKNKTTLIVLLVIGVIFLYCLAYYTVKFLEKSAEQTRYLSAMSWLNAAIREELDDYYQAKGRYPSQLSDLKIPFPGDGAKPEMLSNFKYVTDGNYYEITWSVQFGSGVDTYKEHVVKGKMLFTESYANGKLTSREDLGEGMTIPKSKDDNNVSAKKYGNN